MKSPMSRSFLNTLLYKSLSSVGQRSSREIYNCTRPLPSCSSANDAFPMIRLPIRRPAMVTSRCSSALKLAFISSLGALTANSSAGEGLIPMSRSSCKLWRRPISCSLNSKMFIVSLYSISIIIYGANLRKKYETVGLLVFFMAVRVSFFLQESLYL